MATLGEAQLALNPNPNPNPDPNPNPNPTPNPNEVMADAQLPQLQVVDARLLGMAQEALWRQLRLPEVNAELAAGLSEVEVQACSEEGYPTGGDPNMLSKQVRVRARVRQP